VDKERRGILRWEINSPAKIRMNYKNSIKNFVCLLKNLNLKGFSVSLNKELPALEILKLTIVFPDNESFTAKVKVIWKTVLPESVLYGFSIVSMKDADKNFVYKLISKNHSQDLVKLWWQDQNKEK